jgi:hypothetical protein
VDKAPTGERSYDFYALRYSPERQNLRDLIFREVYEDYFGQGQVLRLLEIREWDVGLIG